MTFWDFFALVGIATVSAFSCLGLYVAVRNLFWGD